MTVAPTNRQSLVDLVVAMVSVPLLVVFGLFLESNMRGDWTSDSDKRWHVLGIGLALLAVSLLVCGYVTHRLGICIWTATQESGNHCQGTRACMSSQLHLVAGGELPPSYESVVSCEMPPPYWSVLVSDGKLMSGLPVAAPKQATG
ncbi:uncharacterized protein LOC110829657 [Zootermopsis nevadensis]|uniref:uncharacterized protein LOC110829657 n=1 Tax=Zootermopsis nevadensis TaxID=136037 RepID=UPI000B8EDE92|nr:uncharacterized protein LOC110829657 [Zootermopsis nevadensis]